MLLFSTGLYITKQKLELNVLTLSRLSDMAHLSENLNLNKNFYFFIDLIIDQDQFSSI